MSEFGFVIDGPDKFSKVCGRWPGVLGPMDLTVLMGEWAILDGGAKHVGSENWRLEEGHDAIEWSSTIERKIPFPHIEKLSVHATSRKWAVKALKIMSRSEQGHEEFFRGRVEKERFQFVVQNVKGRRSDSIEVSSDMEYDFLSPIFNTITFHRLRLRRGQSREIMPLYVDPVSLDGSFELHSVRQRYSREDDQDVEVSAGRFNRAKRYLYENLESGWKSVIWTDNLETVLRYERVYELLSYRQSV